MAKGAATGRPPPTLHPCDAVGCWEWGPFGQGVFLRGGGVARWWCRRHLPADYWDHQVAKAKGPAPGHGPLGQGALF